MSEKAGQDVLAQIQRDMDAVKVLVLELADIVRNDMIDQGNDAIADEIKRLAEARPAARQVEPTYSVKLTYAEMELLIKATHTSNAEMYADADAEYQRAAHIRQKISDKLNDIDARTAK